MIDREDKPMLGLKSVGMAVALAAVVLASIYTLYSTVFAAIGDYPAWLVGFWLLVGFVAVGLAQVASRSTVLIAAVLLAAVATLDYVEILPRVLPMAPPRISQTPVTWLTIGVFVGSALFRAPIFDRVRQASSGE